MGGIIVIDFIDMNKSEHRQQLYEHMREVMANDRARHNILPLSKFGLMQITRQRVRPALDITTTETCPSCFGKGEVQPSLLFTDTLYEKLDYVVNSMALKGFVMYVHPFVDAYIKKGLIFSMYRKWRSQLGRCFKIVPDQSLAYLQYRVVDSEGNELDLREDKDTNSSSTDKKNKAKKRLDGSEATDVNADEKDAKAKNKAKNKAKPQKPKADKDTKEPAEPKEPKEQPQEQKPKETKESKEPKMPQASKEPKTNETESTKQKNEKPKQQPAPETTEPTAIETDSSAQQQQQRRQQQRRKTPKPKPQQQPGNPDTAAESAQNRTEIPARAATIQPDHLLAAPVEQKEANPGITAE